MSGDGGGVSRIAEAAEEQDRAAITDEEILRLAEAGLRVERYFRSPQDIEWAIDDDGELFILQARPLRTDKAKTVPGDTPRDALLLLHGGEPVWPGRAVGPVHVARNPEDEDRTPTGADPGGSPAPARLRAASPAGVRDRGGARDGDGPRGVDLARVPGAEPVRRDGCGR